MAQRKRLAVVFTGRRQLATNLQELAMHRSCMGALAEREVASLAQLTLTSIVARSSVAYGGSGFLVEHHRIPAERDETIPQQHVLMLWTRPTSGEYALSGGRYVHCSKGAGTLTLIPAGVLTAFRTHVPTEVVLCALESDFVEKLLSEADSHREFAPFMRPKFQDSAIRRLITLLLEELRGARRQASSTLTRWRLRSACDMLGWPKPVITVSATHTLLRFHRLPLGALSSR
jgi:hypothetical protein